MFEQSPVTFQVPTSVRTWLKSNEQERIRFGEQDDVTYRSKGLLFEAALQNRFHQQQESVLPKKLEQQSHSTMATIQATSSIVNSEFRVPRLNSNSGSRYLLADAQRQHQYYDSTN
jgi:hypothetical protein